MSSSILSPIRWFIALLPPQPLQDQITDRITDLTTRYQTKTAKAPPHITLVAPFERSLQTSSSELEVRGPHSEPPTPGSGEVQTINGVQQALTTFAASQQPVPIALDGFAAFPPRVLFVNVVQTPELMTLQRSLQDQLQQTCGLPPDRHPRFTPHITVASRNLDCAKFEWLWAELQPQPFAATFTCPSLTLLRYDASGWQIHQDFPLQG